MRGLLAPAGGREPPALPTTSNLKLLPPTLPGALLLQALPELQNLSFTSAALLLKQPPKFPEQDAEEALEIEAVP